MTFKQFTKCCFTFWFYNFINKIVKKQKMMTTFWGKNAEEKQSSATIMISADGKETVFPVKLKLQGE